MQDVSKNPFKMIWIVLTFFLLCCGEFDCVRNKQLSYLIIIIFFLVHRAVVVVVIVVRIVSRAMGSSLMVFRLSHVVWSSHNTPATLLPPHWRIQPTEQQVARVLPVPPSPLPLPPSALTVRKCHQHWAVVSNAPPHLPSLLLALFW